MEAEAKLAIVSGRDGCPNDLEVDSSEGLEGAIAEEVKVVCHYCLGKGGGHTFEGIKPRELEVLGDPLLDLRCVIERVWARRWMEWKGV